MNEKPIRFDCEKTPLIGMLHPADGQPEIGVLVMVAGGPQYRIGGARQLVLWSRKFAAQGFPVLRFDFQGMGDSYGNYLGFEHVEAEMQAALDCFFAEVPTLKQVVLWGECNACSASLFHAYKDQRIGGIVMLNPWVRTEEGKAKTVIKHYYAQRIFERSFWAKVFRFEFDLVSSLRSAMSLIIQARGKANKQPNRERPSEDKRPLPERMLEGLSRYKGQIMLVMSGRDMVAKEFDELLNSSPDWQRELAGHGLVRHDLPFADHTFSTAAWRDQVATWGVDWLINLSRQT